MTTTTNRRSRRGIGSRSSNSRNSFTGSSNRSNRQRPSAGNRSRFGGRSNNRPHTRSSNRFGSNRGRRSGGRGGRKIQEFDVSQYINKNPTQTEPEAVYDATHTFNDFGLEKPLEKAIHYAGLVTPTPIQDQIIPHILNGRDVVGLANTGTGKTAAFLIPLINLTLQDRFRQTLILTPTRELAIQVEQELRKLTPKMRLFSTICVGGTSIGPQLRGLRKRNHFIIGTPGRVIDLIERGAIDPEAIGTVILDEADRMLDMGFIHDMRTILKDIPAERETLCFSATMSPTIEGLVHDFLKEPEFVSVKKKEVTSNIEQDVIQYHGKDKFETLVALLQQDDFKKVIVFGAMKHSVERLSKQLRASGISAESIHGNKTHPQRVRALRNFKEGHAKVLVATDVAARGIHVDHVSHVINYDLPATRDDYVHRIGRTGRGKHRGKALTFVK